VTLYATERLPQPLAISAPVTVDFANMTLMVGRPQDVGGHAALLWREAHSSLANAAELGWPASTAFVYGSAPGHYQFGHATPGPNLTLLFGFTVGTPGAKVYAELVSKPGLSAFVTVDKSTRRFLGVSFRNSGDRV
jgi:hypothetical protein